jgi:hypothetical protein
VMDFADAVIPPDTIPATSDVDYPCRECGKESGPYGGRGPKPKYCIDHKKGSRGASPRAGKVTGAPANLAAQATGVLVQLNGMMALGLMALGFIDTAGAIAGANGTFEEQAYQALMTDTELCKLILKGGVKSAKISLSLAYVGMGVAVVPTAVNEMREKKAERDAKREEAELDASRA